MTRFTRRTYRVARRRALDALFLARHRYIITGAIRGATSNNIGTLIDYYFAEDKARRIVARGRREKGMWHA